MGEQAANTRNSRLPAAETAQLLAKLKVRFEANMARHPGITWERVEAALKEKPDKLWSLSEMERTGGEPDVVSLQKGGPDIVFVDCAPESPAGRRSVCYDRDALLKRKENKPWHSALGMAEEMGITVLDEAQYRALQQSGSFDEKTSSWILTPADVRKQDGGFFCNSHYGRVFLYYNGVQSYYAARGFRGMLLV